MRQATGSFVDGDIVLRRRLPAGVEQVWAALTESDRCARWFARWDGSPGPGDTVSVTWTAEQGEPQSAVTVHECEPPHLLSVASQDQSGVFRLSAVLRSAGPDTELTFTHHGVDPAAAAQFGPGWEFYLDRLEAVVAGREPQAWDPAIETELGPHYTTR